MWIRQSFYCTIRLFFFQQHSSAITILWLNNDNALHPSTTIVLCTVDSFVRNITVLYCTVLDCIAGAMLLQNCNWFLIWIVISVIMLSDSDLFNIINSILLGAVNMLPIALIHNALYIFSQFELFYRCEHIFLFFHYLNDLSLDIRCAESLSVT